MSDNQNFCDTADTEDFVERTNRLNQELNRGQRPVARVRQRPGMTDDHSGGVCPKNGEGVYNWTF